MVLGAGLKFTVVQSQQRSFEWGCTKETQTRKRNFWGMLAKNKKISLPLDSGSSSCDIRLHLSESSGQLVMAKQAMDKGWADAEARARDVPSRSQSVLDVERAIKFRSQVVDARSLGLFHLPHD